MKTLAESLVLLLLRSLQLLLCFLLPAARGDYPILPYSAVWNTPTSRCFGSSLELSRFGIVQNKDDAINGGNITLFTDIGQFPQLDMSDPSDASKWINGGIPQLGNLTLHLEMVNKTITSTIPDPKFSGLAVLNFTAWKPLFQHNFNELHPYQVQSMAYVHRRHPDLNETEQREMAQKEFNKASRSFFKETLDLAHELRPGGRWGYIGYPDCYGLMGYYCDDMAVQENDLLQWLWDASTALYPRYFLRKEQSDEVVSLVSVIHESNRLLAQRTVSAPLFVYLYTRFTYSDGGKVPKNFYSSIDIAQSTDFARLFGVDGVVVWNPPLSDNSNPTCTAVFDFINSTYGPANKDVFNQARDCSNFKCNGHGQCVSNERESLERRAEGIDSISSIQWLQKATVNTSSLTPAAAAGVYIEYDCRCYFEWTGEQCQTPKTTSLS